MIDCGERFHADQLSNYVNAMNDIQAHRGPDSQGCWVDGNSGVGLGHRRLAILDLSESGYQPMRSSSGRYVIVFNGEIYNYKELRKEVEKAHPGLGWRGSSDTEVLLESLEAWGIEETPKRLIGMYAIAVWDSKDRKLFLIRDRLGEKPLYYGWVGKVFAFSSELRALRQLPGWTGKISSEAMSQYLRFGYIPAPYSIYSDIFKQKAGSILCIDGSIRAQRSSPAFNCYWSLEEVVKNAKPFEGSMGEATESVEKLLLDAISAQMQADVPVGVMLSGGLDSSIVTALMQKLSGQRINTFSVGFYESTYNEANFAKEIAKQLGTSHTELYVEPQQALDIIPRLPEIYDEPFGDCSQIPTCLISRLAGTQVKVCLTGDGGDELFGGYNRYIWSQRLDRLSRLIPLASRQRVASLMTAISPEKWDRYLSFVNTMIPKKYRLSTPGDKVTKFARLFSLEHEADFYQEIVTQWKSPGKILGAGEREVDDIFADLPLMHSNMERMMYADMTTYLPDDILVKVDRAAMNVGLETRIPFLDHRLVEFAWKLPPSMKVRHGMGKQVIRNLAYKYLDRNLLERPKAGFAVPIDSWLRGPLKDWADALLSKEELERNGFKDPQQILGCWQEHRSGKRNWHNQLWTILMAQAWFEKYA